MVLGAIHKIRTFFKKIICIYRKENSQVCLVLCELYLNTSHQGYCFCVTNRFFKDGGLSAFVSKYYVICIFYFDSSKNVFLTTISCEQWNCVMKVFEFSCVRSYREGEGGQLKSVHPRTGEERV